MSDWVWFADVFCQKRPTLNGGSIWLGVECDREIQPGSHRAPISLQPKSSPSNLKSVDSGTQWFQGSEVLEPTQDRAQSLGV